MGLFGNMFEKKQCAICGKEIGLLGNRKLADGNMCKDCASLLSPFFSDRRESTVAEIQQQLAYRSENKEKLAGFHPTKTFGNGMKLYVDEENGKFIVTRYSDWASHNPDLIDLSQVTGVEKNIEEHKSEIYTKDAEGKRVSYEPKRYEYEYEFEITIHVNSPWFERINFEISENNRPERLIEKKYSDFKNQLDEIEALLLQKEYVKPAEPKKVDSETVVKPVRPAVMPKPQNAQKPDTWKCPGCGTENTGNFCSQCGTARPKRWFCPKCGTENHGLFCTACGTKIPEGI